MSYPKTGEEVYVSLNLSNTMLTGIGKGTITREEVSVDYLKDLFSRHGVIVSAKPEQARLLNLVNEQYDLKLEIPEKLKLFQLSEQHRRLVVINVSGLRRSGGGRGYRRQAALWKCFETYCPTPMRKNHIKLSEAIISFLPP